ncbi:MAG: LysE family transporter [Rikenellaceae bacterium]
MNFIFLIKGLVIGFLASIPLGPVGVLCLQRTVSKRFMSGFVSGLGAASADVIFAVIAMFFLSLIAVVIEQQMSLLALIGGSVVMVIGIFIFNKKTTPKTLRKNRAQYPNYFKDYITTFFLTLTNPAFIFVFVGLFSSFDIGNEDLCLYNGVLTIIGVAFGASLWWFTLTSTVNIFKNRFRPRHLVSINRIAGILIFALGLFAIITAILDMLN